MLEIVGVCLAAIAAGAAIYYARVAYRQWEAASEANRIALTARRPWLEAKISIAKPLTFYDNYAEVDLTIKARNGGTAPAIGSEPMLDLIIVGTSDGGENPVLKQQNTWCSPKTINAWTKAGGKLGGGRLLLPNSEVTYPTWGLQSGRQSWQLSPNGEVLAVWITGCIIYLDEFGSSHATLVTLLLATSYPFKPRPGLVIDGFWGLATYGHGAY